jgi:hypothetical protein
VDISKNLKLFSPRGLNKDQKTFSFLTPLLHNLKPKNIMEAIILSKEQFDGLISKINEIHEKLNAKTAPKQEVFLDNEELIAMLKISRRTAQTWRDEGKISFSQVGSKIYYKLSDVEKQCRITTTNPLQKSD